MAKFPKSFISPPKWFEIMLSALNYCGDDIAAEFDRLKKENARLKKDLASSRRLERE